jgi:hypothetical protein
MGQQKVLQERGDIKISATILGRHLAAYKWLENFYVVLKSLFYE